MKKKNTRLKSDNEVDVNELHELRGFNGVARSIECIKHNSMFNGFKIVTIHIQDNLVCKIDYSDTYNSFEALDQLEVLNIRAFDNLNMNYKNGKSFQK